MRNRTFAFALVSLLCAPSLQALPGTLPITLVSLCNILRMLPKEIASPHNGQALAAQVPALLPHVANLRGVAQALWSPAVSDAVRQAPPAQQRLALALAGKVARRAALYNRCIPGLLQQPPFDELQEVMRHAMQGEWVGQDEILRHLPYE